jgi:hypothetical protein
VLLAAFGAHFAYFQTTASPIHSDFGQVWFAARAVLHGQNPYALIGPGREFQWTAPLFYPLSATFVALPLAALSEAAAVAVFVAVGVFAFAWALTEYGFGPLWGAASFCLVHAVGVVQWSPLFVGAYAIAPLGLLLVAKPTVGFAVFTAKPSLWPIVGGIVLTALAFLVQPHWFPAWREALRAASIGEGSAFPYTAPIIYPGGVLVLLALSRWRRPEARLLVALACVPHTTLPYEGLLLFLVPRGWRQALTLTVLSWVNYFFVLALIQPHTPTAAILAYGPTMVALLYLPATIMVLRRPNEGFDIAAFSSRAPVGRS